MKPAIIPASLEWKRCAKASMAENPIVVINTVAARDIQTLPLNGQNIEAQITLNKRPSEAA
jgi:hypothetical protein